MARSSVLCKAGQFRLVQSHAASTPPSLSLCGTNLEPPAAFEAVLTMAAEAASKLLTARPNERSTATDAAVCADFALLPDLCHGPGPAVLYMIRLMLIFLRS